MKLKIWGENMYVTKNLMINLIENVCVFAENEEDFPCNKNYFYLLTINILFCSQFNSGEFLEV